MFNYLVTLNALNDTCDIMCDDMITPYANCLELNLIHIELGNMSNALMQGFSNFLVHVPLFGLTRTQYQVGLCWALRTSMNLWYTDAISTSSPPPEIPVTRSPLRSRDYSQFCKVVTSNGRCTYDDIYYSY